MAALGTSGNGAARRNSDGMPRCQVCGVIVGIGRKFCSAHDRDEAEPPRRRPTSTQDDHLAARIDAIERRLTEAQGAPLPRQRRAIEKLFKRIEAIEARLGLAPEGAEPPPPATVEPPETVHNFAIAEAAQALLDMNRQASKDPQLGPIYARRCREWAVECHDAILRAYEQQGYRFTLIKQPENTTTIEQ